MNTNENKLIDNDVNSELSQMDVKDYEKYRELLAAEIKFEQAKVGKQKRLSIAKRIASIFGVIAEMILYLTAIIPLTKLTILGNLPPFKDEHTLIWDTIKESLLGDSRIMEIFGTLGISFTINVTWILLTTFTFWLISIVVIDIVVVTKELIKTSRNIVDDITENVKDSGLSKPKTSLFTKIFSPMSRFNNTTKIMSTAEALEITKNNVKNLDDTDELDDIDKYLRYDTEDLIDGDVVDDVVNDETTVEETKKSTEKEDKSTEKEDK